MNEQKRVPFEGTLCYLDKPSDASPSLLDSSRTKTSLGNSPKLVLLTKAAEEALPSLIGKKINFKPQWNGHDPNNELGIITNAAIFNSSILVEGYLHAKYISEIEYISKNIMGMSYDMKDAHITDMRKEVWEINKCTFTGAAVLLRDLASYKNSSFKLLDPLVIKSIAAGSEEM